MENNIKKYDLKIKRVFINLIISALLLVFVYHMLCVASDEEKFRHFMIEYTIFAQGKTYAFGSVYISGVYAILVLVYMLELLIYKIKDVLILNNDGITYYAPEYKKVFIPKDKIKDIYITNHKQMKIILKDYEIKKNIRSFIWTTLKDLPLGHNPKNVFRIDLNFIQCDINEIRKYLIQFSLDAGSSEANELINNILQQYNYKNIEELRKDEKSLAECVMKLYKMEKFTQVEISSIIGINTSKVSKLIRKGLS